MFSPAAKYVPLLASVPVAVVVPTSPNIDAACAELDDGDPDVPPPVGPCPLGAGADEGIGACPLVPEADEGTGAGPLAPEADVGPVACPLALLAGF